MKKVYFYFCHRKRFNPISRLIKFFQKMPSSHVAFAIETGFNRTILYHASFSGVQFQKYEKFQEKFQIDYVYSVELSDPKEIYKFCIDHLDTGYSISSLLFHLFNSFGFKFGSLLGGNGLICSSLAGKIIEAHGHQLKTDPRKWDLITAKQEIERIYGR